MSLAPASSRGAFLKARLAVNGIQCAARSFGTLTAGWAGLLSSMGASSRVGDDGLARGYQLHAHGGIQPGAIFAPNSLSEIGGGDPEHLALGVFRVKPEQRQGGEGCLDVVAAAADLAQQSTLRGEMGFRLAQDSPDN